MVTATKPKRRSSALRRPIAKSPLAAIERDRWIGYPIGYVEMLRKVRHRVDALEQLECCDAHSGKEGIDVAGNKQTNAYVVSLEVLGDNAERSPHR
jgi:hypothetical protein